MTTILIQPDLEQIKQLPIDVQERGREFPAALAQIAQGLNLEPLDADYQARSIEVYLNGSVKAAATFHGNVLIDLQVNDLFDGDWATLVIEIDGQYRYGEILGKIANDKLGSFVLPDALLGKKVINSATLELLPTHEDFKDSEF